MKPKRSPGVGAGHAPGVEGRVVEHAADVRVAVLVELAGVGGRPARVHLQHHREAAYSDTVLHRVVPQQTPREWLWDTQSTAGRHSVRTFTYTLGRGRPVVEDATRSWP